MRRWLGLSALSVTSLVIVAFLIPLAILIRDLSADRALTAAEREAQAIARFVAVTPPNGLDSLEASLGSIDRISIVVPDGTVLGAELPNNIDLEAAQTRVQAYRQPLSDGEAVIVPVLRSADEVWVVVVDVPREELTENVATAWLILGGLGLSMMALALFVADRIGLAVVRPVNDLVEATHALGRGDLDVRVTPAGPHELEEVGAAFNTLTRRVESLMNRERESAADLAHRLRTPLTALKLDVEAMSAHADVSRLQRDVDALERVTSQIIADARRPLRTDARCDLVSIVTERATFWGHLAADQERECELVIDIDSLIVEAHSDDVAASLDAILGNIFAHTEPGIGYRVHLSGGDGLAVIEVSDEGPGIASPGLLRRGASGGTSSGLGVDIVRALAEELGGRAEWQTGVQGGTKVRIELPTTRDA